MLPVILLAMNNGNRRQGEGNLRYLVILMGVSMFNACISSPYAVPNSNPDPHNFIVKWSEQKNGFILILVNYPDAKNFEGNKLLLYRWDKTFPELMVALNNVLDPHFSESLSPVARFTPTDEGKILAYTIINNFKI